MVQASTSKGTEEEISFPTQQKMTITKAARNLLLSRCPKWKTRKRECL